MNAQSTSHSSILKGGTNHKVVKNSGQKNGETWQEFFARRSEEHSRTKEKESAADRTKRKQRADHASQGGAPGRKGARVFYWEEEDDGFRVRTPMGRDRASNEWSRYTRGRKRYDEFADEWDICTDFDSNDAFSSEESDNEAEDGFLGPTVLQKRDTATSLDIPLEPAEPVGKENGGKEATSSDIPPEPAEPVGEEVAMSVNSREDRTAYRQPPTSPRQSVKPLIDFHIDYLVRLLESHHELLDSVLLLQDSIKILMAGSKPAIVFWHLRRLKRMSPNTPEIEEAFNMLSECISHVDML
ncbi:hypothetical protein L210DRAFT_3652156 [Boletus edulis BED1]|uniref:Uncharacterized protein n=1 Tax=Boletus edulis BED1 TaxID=1328754 RepID=A0AAD4BHA9_BOLED|nr:hypothetical protein L210DRAFT_3652777 [Boletus edulis BED1]KAF8429405.1 hypothetical protein L210DRAFT_3652156 [Boletus edulis BED1]